MKIKYFPIISVPTVLKYQLLCLLKSKLFLACLIASLFLVGASVFIESELISKLTVLFSGGWFAFLLWFGYCSSEEIKRLCFKHRSTRYYSFDDKGMEGGNDNVSIAHKWDVFCRVVEKNDCYSFTKIDGQGDLIVFKGSVSEQEVDDIREILNKSPIPDKQLLRSE